MSDALKPLLDPTLGAMEGVRHGFFTRQGGVSMGLYNSLNTGLGSRDNVPHVKVNRARILAYLGGDAFLTVYQHHSATLHSYRRALAVERRTARRWHRDGNAWPGYLRPGR
jgi:copper oxidase (laccase) domain-containing protein